MTGIMLLSEVHPNTALIQPDAFNDIDKLDPLEQAHTWFNLFEPDNIAQVRKTFSFAEIIAGIEKRASSLGLTTVIRDWTHLDYIATPFLHAATMQLTTRAVLIERFDVISAATVRHPIDQWFSLKRVPLMRSLSFDHYLLGYRKFAEVARNIGFIRYEDFTRDPLAEMTRLCAMLDLAVDPGFLERWCDYTRITGDSSSARTIQPAGEPAVEQSIRDAFNSHPNYRMACDLLGYER